MSASSVPTPAGVSSGVIRDAAFPPLAGKYCGCQSVAKSFFP